VTLAALPYGDRAWLIECPGDPVALAQWLMGLAWAGRPEVVVGARTCLLRFAGPAPGRAALAEILADAPAPAPPSTAGAQVVTIGVRYDGEDLAAVADLAGLTVAAVVALHSGATYRVDFLGFAPGFAYLSGLPRALHLPRRSVPRIRVPAGAVAIADRYSAVYPSSSPGGWHLLGTSGEWLFDVERQPPSRLRPGALVRFEGLP